MVAEKMEIPLFGRFDLMIVGLIISLSILIIGFKILFEFCNKFEKLIYLIYFRLFILPKQVKQEQRMKELLDIKEQLIKHE